MKFSAILVAAVAMEVASSQYYEQPRRLRAVTVSRGLEGHTDAGWGGSAGSGAKPASTKAEKMSMPDSSSAKADKT